MYSSVEEIAMSLEAVEKRVQALENLLFITGRQVDRLEQFAGDHKRYHRESE